MVRNRRTLVLALIALVLGGAFLLRTVREPVGRAVVASRAPVAGGAAEDLPLVGLSRLSAERGEAPLGKRDLFEFGSHAPAPTPVTASAPAPTAAPTPPPEPGPPPVPPLSVKYIGSLEDRRGLKVAVLMTDRKEILTGQTGDLVANRFKIVKIGFESVDIQDVGSDRVRRVPLKGN